MSIEEAEGWGLQGGKVFTPYANPRLEDGPPGEYLPSALLRNHRLHEAQKQNLLA